MSRAEPTCAAKLPRRRWLQFSLRTLLGAILVAAVFLGWWFRPFVLETRRGDRTLRTRFEVRWDWRGRVVSHGTQAWYLRDGTRFTTTDYGTALDDLESYPLSGPNIDFHSPVLIWLIEDNDILASRGTPWIDLDINLRQTPQDP